MLIHKICCIGKPMVATLKKLRHIHDEFSGDHHDRFFIPQKSNLELVKMFVQHQK